MYFKSLAATALLSVSAVLAAPAVSICDKYTTALLVNNTAANQYLLLTLVVNTAVIGNYTKPNVGIAVPGILAPGQYNGEWVNLLPYFNGCLKDANRGGKEGVAINFLDGGGAAPLMKNMPANDNTSNQYMLLTHLYQFFGKLLGCSGYGQPGFPMYAGQQGQYQVHKFMDLDANQIGWFIQQVGLAAASFGVTQADVATIGTTLNTVFNYRCSPPVNLVGTSALQSICDNPEKCPLDPNAMCQLYESPYPHPAYSGNCPAGSWGSSGGNGGGWEH